jgi:hypothetical protein
MSMEPLDFKKLDICPACGGTGEIEFDDGFDEDGQLTPTYMIKCYRCKVNVGKWHQPLEEMRELGKTIYIDAEPEA